ncbi:MAG TPA: radical SAM protein [Nitrospirota bacterium]|nr:radical SAM protein [Nitrospirota bacterium]
MIIPFFIPHSGCPHQCIFCNQKKITGQHEIPDATRLPQKINGYLRNDRSDNPAQIAFYGGSFTALPQDTQKAFLEAVRPFIRSGRIRSIRLSTRPDCISREVLDLLNEYHVETIELGAQSMDDRVLMLSGRGHTEADTVNAVTLLGKYNFTVGLQLMPGLPGDSAHGFLNTVNKTIALKPDFVRLYPTIVIKDTPLEELYHTGRYVPLSFDETVSLCRDALTRFEQNGIKVIRIGLQPTEELRKPGTIVAGPYHPSFRQHVESSIFLDKMRAVLTGKVFLEHKAVILVNPSDIDASIGQKRSNVGILKKEFSIHVIIRSDHNIPKKTVKLME